MCVYMCLWVYVCVCMFVCMCMLANVCVCMSVYIYACVYVCLHIYIYLPNLSEQAGCDTSSIFKQSITGLNLEFSFFQTGCHTKVKEISLPCFLLKAGERTVGIIPFSRILLPCEIETASSWIWTRVTGSISYCCILTSDLTKLSNEKCSCVNNRCIWSKRSGDNLDCRRVELGVNCDAHRK